MKNHKKDESAHIHQRKKMDIKLNIRELPWTEKQKKLISLIDDKNSKMVLIKGPAGSSKSVISVYSALKALNDGKVSNILYSRPILESSDTGSRLGFLPGEKFQKELPYMSVIFSKLEELLPKGDIEKLKAEKLVEFIEVNFIRGGGQNAICWIMDEAQGWTLAELITLVTRVGQRNKIIICFDPEQSDLPIQKQGGITKLWDLFNDEESKAQGIYTFEFDEDDIMRSELCKFIVKRLKNLKK